jgi:hypothetical protein
VDENLGDALQLGLAQDAVKVLEHSVHARVGNDAHQVEPGSAGFHAFHGGTPNLVCFQLLFGKEFVQPTNS